LLLTFCIYSWEGTIPSQTYVHTVKLFIILKALPYSATVVLPFPLQNPYTKCTPAYSSYVNVKGILPTLLHNKNSLHQLNASQWEYTCYSNSNVLHYTII